MSKKILELTEKIYTEGIEKAKKEAELIIGKAQKEADSIINNAKKKEIEIVTNAQNQAVENITKSSTEIRLAGRQFISNLKQQINTLITTFQVEKPVNEAFENDGFMHDIILTIINNWDPKKPEELNISQLLPQKKEKKLRGFFNKKAKHLLDSGLEIKFDASIENGFKIGPKDGTYHISFTDKDFENYFKTYLKPKTKKMLFD